MAEYIDASNPSIVALPLLIVSVTLNPILRLSPVFAYAEFELLLFTDTISIGESIYASVTSHDDFGTQLIDITNPESPSKVSVFDNTGNYDAADDITIINLKGYIYTLTASIYSAVVIISDITNPAKPSARGHIIFTTPPILSLFGIRIDDHYGDIKHIHLCSNIISI